MLGTLDTAFVAILGKKEIPVPSGKPIYSTGCITNIAHNINIGPLGDPNFDPTSTAEWIVGNGQTPSLFFSNAGYCHALRVHPKWYFQDVDGEKHKQRVPEPSTGETVQLFWEYSTGFWFEPCGKFMGGTTSPFSSDPDPSVVQSVELEDAPNATTGTIYPGMKYADIHCLQTWTDRYIYWQHRLRIICGGVETTSAWGWNYCNIENLAQGTGGGIVQTNCQP